MKILGIILVIIIITNTNCKKPKPEPPECPNGACDTLPKGEHFDLIWRHISSYSMEPLFYENDIIFSDKFSGNSEVIHCVNKLDGNPIWEYDQLGNKTVVHGSSEFIFQNKFVFTTGTGYTLDANTGQELLIFTKDNDGNRISKVGNYIYRNYFETFQNADSCTLERAIIGSDEWEDIFTITKEEENGFSPDILPPVHWLNPEGDTILLFQIRFYNFAELEGKVDFYAFNLSSRTVEWKIQNITESGNSSVYLPIVKGNNVLFQGSNSIHCINISTGEIVWEKLFYNESFFTSSMIVKYNLLVINGESSSMHCINTETGDIVWENQNAGYASPTSTNIIVYNDKIYFGHGKLKCFDLFTGEKLWEESSPNLDLSWNAKFGGADIIIDEETGYLYTGDKEYFMCLKLKD